MSKHQWKKEIIVFMHQTRVFCNNNDIVIFIAYIHTTGSCWAQSSTTAATDYMVSPAWAMPW